MSCGVQFGVQDSGGSVLRIASASALVATVSPLMAGPQKSACSWRTLQELANLQPSKLILRMVGVAVQDPVRIRERR
jgi:hypothetical protein